MEINSDERAIALAEYIIRNNATVRAAAKANAVSKSTVHSDVTKRLQKIDGELYGKVRKILQTNKAEKHIRGGIATKRKYEEITLLQRYSSK